MPADTSILMGFRPAQIESPDVQNARAAQMRNAEQQNVLGALQLAERGREQQMNNALNQAYKDAYRSEGGLDTNLLRQKLATGGFGSKLPELEKRLGEIETEKLKRDELKGKISALPYELSKKQSEAVQERLNQTKRIYETLDPNDPNVASKYLAIHNSVHDDALLGPLLSKMGVNKQDSIVDINRAASTPGGMKDLIQRSIMGTQKFIEFTAPKTEKVDAGGRVEFRDLNPNSPTYGQLVGPKTVNKSATVSDQIARERLNKETDPRLVAQTITDKAGNVTLLNKKGEVISTLEGKGKPSATFEKTEAQKKQLEKDANIVISELDKAVKDGGLIDQSTGSGAGAIYDYGARFVGKATKGDLAIGQLKPIADLALKMVPRFEGAQSNADVISYNAAAGQLADPTLPNEIRKAAGKEVLRIMKKRKGEFGRADMESGNAPPAGFVVDN
jgi:hypothetical protein